MYDKSIKKSLSFALHPSVLVLSQFQNEWKSLPHSLILLLLYKRINWPQLVHLLCPVQYLNLLVTIAPKAHVSVRSDLSFGFKLFMTCSFLNWSSIKSWQYSRLQASPLMNQSKTQVILATASLQSLTGKHEVYAWKAEAGKFEASRLYTGEPVYKIKLIIRIWLESRSPCKPQEKVKAVSMHEKDQKNNLIWTASSPQIQGPTPFQNWGSLTVFRMRLNNP